MQVSFIFDDLHSNYVDVEINDKGIKKKKKLFPEAAIQMLNQSTTFSFCNHIGRMPRGYVDANFDFSSMSGKVIIHVAAHVQKMDFNGSVGLIPFPSLILLFKFKDGKHMESYAFGTKEDTLGKITQYTELYNYPYGNVYSDSGRVCWGGNTHEPIKALWEVDILTDKFLNSSSNSDLYRLGTSNASGLKLEELLVKLNEKDSFPKKYLVKSKNTIGKLLD